MIKHDPISWWEIVIYAICIAIILFICCTNAVNKAAAAWYAEDLTIFTMAQDSRYELIPTITYLTAFYPSEERIGCEDNTLDYGDVAVDFESSGLCYGDKVLIFSYRLGWIAGEHKVADKINPCYWWRIDLYVPRKYLASAITGMALIVRVK